MNQESAKQIAQQYLNERSRKQNYEAVILDDNTLERDRIYVFFYQSRKYLQTNDINYSLTGNSPILIEKDTGQVIETGNEHNLEYYLENYERYGSIYPPERDT